MKKKVVIAVVVALLLLGALSRCGSSSSSSDSSATATTATTASQSSPQSAQQSGASDLKKAKKEFVGTWDMVKLEYDGYSYGEKQLQASREGGTDFYLVLNDDMTGSIVFANKRIDVKWEAVDATSGKLIVDNSFSRFTYEDGILSISDDSMPMAFKKGKARASLPPLADSSEEGAQSAAAEAINEAAEEATDSGAVNPEFKEMLDSYEAFMDEYVEFMQNYQNSDDTLSMLQQYTDFLQRYSDYMQKIDDIDTDSLSAADYAYYIEVTSRVSQKLLTVSGI